MELHLFAEFLVRILGAGALGLGGGCRIFAGVGTFDVPNSVLPRKYGEH